MERSLELVQRAREGDRQAAQTMIEENSGLSVEVPVRLGEVSDADLAALSANGKIKVWQDGIEIPLTAVPEGTITADTIATMDQDGTMHILIAPQVTGTQEAIDAIQRCIRITKEPAAPCKLIHAFVSSEQVERL